MWEKAENYKGKVGGALVMYTLEYLVVSWDWQRDIVGTQVAT